MKANLFWSKVAIAGPNECWPWMAFRMKTGYGQTTVNGRRTTAHRIAWELTNGPITDGSWVLHRCDNPPCCNPSHLWLGTQFDNMQDAARKGRVSSQRRPERQPRGDAHYLRKRTHCKNGHPFLGANIMWTKNGKARQCRICIYAANKAWHDRHYVPKPHRYHNAEKTHCIRGHEFTPENTYVAPKSGKRQCRTCTGRKPL